MLEKLIGDRAFFRRVMIIAIPIIVQNGITNFVSLLDNIMVGQVGTAQMSGVSIVNNLLFVFNVCVFGATSGPGIFTAQFFGCRDHDGIRHTFRFKAFITLGITALGLFLFRFWGSDLIMLYLQGEGDAAVIHASLSYGLEYLNLMLLGLIPFSLANAYSSTLRECGETVVPMVAGIVAVVVNLALNYVLIFGQFGFPALGVNGAAVATVVSRYAELFIVGFWTHRNPGKNPFIRGAYRSVHIPGRLFGQMTLKGLPLLINEFFWASSVAFLNQCYTIRGYEVVGALNISTTLSNLSNVVFMAVANAVGIIMGQMLGSGARESEVRDANRKLINIAVFSCVIFGGLMAAVSGLFPRIYNTIPEVQQLAAILICISAAIMPFSAYTTSAYFTLRSGGKTTVTFLFDSGFAWFVLIPTAFLLSRFTVLPIVPLYAICQSLELLKSFVGFLMVKKGSWIQNLTVS